MITSVHIHNFKVFSDVEQPIAPLTVLTGLNGRGKSSFIQAILLAWSTVKNERTFIALDNEYVNLKTVGDVFSWYNIDDIFMLRLNCDKHSFLLESNPVKPHNTLENGFALNDANSHNYNLLSSRLLYLSTWRMGDLSKFPQPPPSQMTSSSLSVEHGDALLTPRYLDLFANTSLSIPSLVRSQAESPCLFSEVEAWLKVVSPDLSLRISRGSSEMKVSYYPLDTRGNPTQFADAINVGYGISYALPVITSILASKPGDIVIIETPEAHIHPAGQARLMDLFARAAAAGVQIILETHSDHIIHGLLRNLKAEVIREEDACVLYFDKQEGEDAQDGIVISSLPCSSNGRIKRAPKGFFDQYMIDMDELL